MPPGVFGVTQSRILSLSKAEKLVLMDPGALELIHGHQISLSHCNWMLRAQQNLAHRTAADKYTKNSEVSGFLHAMANAHIDDLPKCSGA